MHPLAPTLTSAAAHAGDSAPHVVYQSTEPAPLIFEARIARNGRGQPSAVAPALRATNGTSGSGDGSPLCCLPMLEVTGRVGHHPTTGTGIGQPDDPMFTLQAQQVHGICLSFHPQDSGGDVGDVAPTLRAGQHTTSHANGGVSPAVLLAFTMADTAGDSGIVAPTMRVGGGWGNGGLAVADVRQQMPHHATSHANTAVALAIQTAQGGANGRGVAGVAYTMDTAAVQAVLVVCEAACTGRSPQTATDGTFPLRGDTGSGGRQFVAFAQNQRAEVRPLAVAGALAADPGAQQQTYLATFLQSSQTGRGTVGYAPDAAITPPIRTAADQVNVQLATLVRRLTPRECERLQGFPDGFTMLPRDPAHVARQVQRLRRQLATRDLDLDDATLARMIGDGPRYRAIGNSMAVPVMRWLAQRIALVAAHPNDGQVPPSTTQPIPWFTDKGGSS